MPEKIAANATSTLLNQRLRAPGSKLLDTLRKALKRKLPRSTGAIQIEDFVNSFMLKLVRQDGLWKYIEAGETVSDQHLANWAVRSAFSDIRNEGTEPVSREMYGARTQAERAKNSTIGGSNDPRLTRRTADDAEPWVDIADTDSPLTAEAMSEGIHVDQIWSRLESDILAKHPDRADLLLGVLRQRATGATVPEIAVSEGLTTTQATSLMAEARKVARTSIEALNGEGRSRARKTDGRRVPAHLPATAQVPAHDPVPTPRNSGSDDNALALLREIRLLLLRLVGAPSGERGKRLHDVREAARLLGMSPGSIYFHAARGRIPGITRLGRRLLFRTVALEDWLGPGSAP